MASNAHHNTPLLLNPAVLLVIIGSVLVLMIFALSGHHLTFSALIGTALVIAGFGALQLLTAGAGHGHGHGHGSGHH